MTKTQDKMTKTELQLKWKPQQQKNINKKL